MPNIDLVAVARVLAGLVLILIVIGLMMATVWGILPMFTMGESALLDVMNVPWTDVGVTSMWTWPTMVRTGESDVLGLLKAIQSWVIGYWLMRVTVGLYNRLVVMING